MAADTPQGVMTASAKTQKSAGFHRAKRPEDQNPLVMRHVVQLQDRRRARLLRLVMGEEEDLQDVVRLLPCGMRRH